MIQELSGIYIGNILLQKRPDMESNIQQTDENNRIDHPQ